MIFKVNLFCKNKRTGQETALCLYAKQKSHLTHANLT